MSFRVKNERCHFCTKSVYAMDRMAADGIVFHKGCMKCEHCKATLSLGNYAALNGKYYCKPHFKQLFQTKGNYSDGFGEDKPTAKWGDSVYTGVTPGANFTKPSKPAGSPSTLRDSPKPAASPASEKKSEEPKPAAVESTPEPTPEVSTHEPVQEEHSVEVPSIHVEVSASQPESYSEPEPEPEPQSLSERMSNFTVSDSSAPTPSSPSTSHVSTPPSVGSPSGLSIKKDRCAVCEKTVYAMEKMIADGVVFHKNCMKCTHCSKTLGLGNFAALNGKYYCKPHFKQLFQTKGNYSDGFGEDAPTSGWAPQAPGYATGQKKFF